MRRGKLAENSEDWKIGLMPQSTSLFLSHSHHPLAQLTGGWKRCEAYLLPTEASNRTGGIWEKSRYWSQWRRKLPRILAITVRARPRPRDEHCIVTPRCRHRQFTHPVFRAVKPSQGKPCEEEQLVFPL
ncbi:Ataxin-7 [Manis pentadactyla]|nr:Ataxin-7 [Manis pentadactyla]